MMKNKLFANHEARYIVNSSSRKVRKTFYGIDVEMDSRGWPLQISCDYMNLPVVKPDYEMKGIGMTYKIDNPNVK